MAHLSAENLRLVILLSCPHGRTIVLKIVQKLDDLESKNMLIFGVKCDVRLYLNCNFIANTGFEEFWVGD